MKLHCFAIALVLISILPRGLGPPAVRAASPPHTASITAHGLRLTLQTPRAAYPPDALVPVTVRLRNVSTVAIPIDNGCGIFVAALDMFSASGHKVYEPSVPAMPGRPGCDAIPPPVRIFPDRTWTWTRLVILRGRRLQASVAVAASTQINSPTQAMHTPLLAIRTLPALKTVSEVVTSPRVRARLSRPPSAAAYYTDRITCAPPFNTVGGTPDWQSVPGSTIRPRLPSPCPVPSRWQIAIAVQGESPHWFDVRIPPPPLPAGGDVLSGPCTYRSHPGAGAIALVWRGAVYLSGPNTGTACRIPGPASAVEAQVSPHGGAVAVVAALPGKRYPYGLWIVGGSMGLADVRRAQGAVIYRVDSSLAWSPGGKWLAYTVGNGVKIVNSRGEHLRSIISGQRPVGVSPPVTWTATGSSVATIHYVFGSALAEDVVIARTDGYHSAARVRFPTWMYHPQARPVGSLPGNDVAFTRDGRHLVLSTAGGGTRLSGVWEAPVSGGTAHLVLGTRARVNGYQKHGTHLDGATHVFGSPDGSRLAIDATRGFWIVDTERLKGRVIPAPLTSGCVQTQSGWTAAGQAIAFVQTCPLDHERAFRSDLWVTPLNSGAPHRLLSEIDRVPDAVRIAPLSRYLIAGY